MIADIVRLDDDEHDLREKPEAGITDDSGGNEILTDESREGMRPDGPESRRGTSRSTMKWTHGMTIKKTQ